MIFTPVRYLICFAILGICALPAAAAVIYTDSLDTSGSASNYNAFITAGASGPSGDATFGYDYGADPSTGGLGIPVAPHTTDGSKTGLRLRTDNLQSSVGTVVGASVVSSKTLSLPSSYQVQVDVWSNYIGGSSIAASGSNGSTGVAVGIGTAGTAIQYLNVTNDGIQMEAFGDNGGGADGAYRVYPGTTSPRPVPTNSNYYAAGTASGSATFSNAYYTSAYPAATAPAGQVTYSSATQGGSTPAGVQGFAWHTWLVTNDTANINWYIDGKLITSVPTSAAPLAGQQVSLGNIDTGLTGNSAAANQLLNAQVFDNLIVSDFPAVPEPASCGLLMLGLAMVVGARRTRKAA
jgi:hypothetical protein